jgi:acetolactate synthase-1/2/3 large subunit
MYGTGMTIPKLVDTDYFGQEFIHYIQDTIDQRGIVRGYTRFDHEIRTGKNVKQNIMRAAQMAKSEPQGPTYLIASREVLEEKVESVQITKKHWKPVAPAGLSPDSIKEIGDALLKAKNPCVITTYLGRDTRAVSELVTLCESLGIAVLVSLSCIQLQIISSLRIVGSGTVIPQFPARPSALHG